jgi:hypothetical protein
MIKHILRHASRIDANGLAGQPYISMRYNAMQTPHGLLYSFNVDQEPFNLLPDDRGVYFLLSHQRTRLQKIGMTNGLKGLKQRIRDYLKSFDPNNPGNDASPALWYRIMTGNDLRKNRGGERNIDDSPIDVYFRSFTQDQQTNDPLTARLGFTHLSYDPHADLERRLIDLVRILRSDYRNQNPNNLFPDDYPFPLLLDSVNRIPADQFAPPQ